MAGGFNDLLEELFAPLGGVSLRRMFGGIGVFRAGLMFALVTDDVLYMKADDATSPAFAAEGCGPWVYSAHSGKSVEMPYWRVPERLFDEPEDFTEWARTAFAVAERKKKAKPVKKAKQSRR